ncbi:MAG TPA: ABC transporter permease, partial [Vicinamibacterales bacterium]|nr:ABC transporter permease [Vicinamibacterales bacterium]
MKRPWTVRGYAWLLGRGVPGLSREDIDDAAADVDRLRREARRESLGAAGRFWLHELRALARTVADERRRLRPIAGEPAGVAAGLRRQVDTIVYDVRHAVRGLARDRLATIFVLVSLALGIGANAITLGLVDRLLLQGPPQIAEPGRLVRLYRRAPRTPAGDQASPWLPFVTYRQLAVRLHGVDAIGAYGVRDTMVGVGAQARITRVGMTQGAFFPTLRLTPALGRYFTPDEDAATAGALAILSDRLWHTDFGADPAALGRTIAIDGIPHTIVGVTPRGFSGPQFDRVDAWTLGSTRTADSYNWKVIVRLSPGASVSSLSSDLARIRAQAVDDEPKWMNGTTLFAAPIRYDDSGRESIEVRIAWWMTGVAAIILVVACANVVNILLARLTRRRRELAVRVALGSGRARLLRLIALDGVALSVAGGTIGLWLAGAIGPTVRQALFPSGGDWTTRGLELRLIAIVAGIVATTALAIGIAPAIGANH